MKLILCQVLLTRVFFFLNLVVSRPLAVVNPHGLKSGAATVFRLLNPLEMVDYPFQL